MRLLDTDILIDLGRSYPPARSWYAAAQGEAFLVPGFVVFELLTGCDNSLAVRRLQRWLQPFRIYWPNAMDCERAMATFARLSLSHGLGMIDVLIAESAIGLGVPLCTFNVRHFRAIPGLVTEQPYQRI